VKKAAALAAPAKTAVQPSPAPPCPKISLDEAIRHDPFALPPALATAVAAQSSKTKNPFAQPDDRSHRMRQAVDALRSKGVQMVLLGGTEQLAVVGGRAVRVGDTLDGLRVISINPRGITLSEPGDSRQGSNAKERP